MKRTQTKQNGFTLIELLVVITIITLLISILLPALAAARNAAQSIQCMSNQRQAALAFSMWSNDHDGKVLPVSVSNPNGRRARWSDILVGNPRNLPSSSPTQYLGDKHALVCPEQTNDDALSDYYGLLRIGYGYNYMHLNSVTVIEQYPTQGLRPYYGPTTNSVRGHPELCVQYFRQITVSPSDLYVWMDACEMEKGLGTGYFIVGAHGHATGVVTHGNRPAARHNGSINVTFADFHVESIKADPQNPYPALGRYQIVSDTGNTWAPRVNTVDY